MQPTFAGLLLAVETAVPFGHPQGLALLNPGNFVLLKQCRPGARSLRNFDFSLLLSPDYH
jgi:hypothetical protein